jgi:hypothetical protein
MLKGSEILHFPFLGKKVLRVKITLQYILVCFRESIFFIQPAQYARNVDILHYCWSGCIKQAKIFFVKVVLSGNDVRLENGGRPRNEGSWGFVATERDGNETERERARSAKMS